MKPEVVAFLLKKTKGAELVKIKVLSMLLREIKEVVTNEQFKRIEDVVLDVAENSGDVKAVAAAKILRLVLNVEDY